MCCPNILGCVVSHWSTIDLQQGTLLEKTVVPSRSWQLPIAPQLRVDFVPNSLSLLGFGLAWVLCVLSQPPWVRTCCCPTVSRGIFPCKHLLPLALILFWLHLPQWSLSLGRRACGVYVPFLAGCSEVLILCTCRLTFSIVYTSRSKGISVMVSQPWA